jgi:RNase P subunit RPR2
MLREPAVQSLGREEELSAAKITNDQEIEAMTCGRCGGFMIIEVTSAYPEGSARSESQRTRCLNCGNVEDSVICRNRTNRISTNRSIARLREGLRL